MLINAAQAARPGRGWWRNILDLYGAADILVAEVMVHRLYPGGPAKARFIGRHGPDGEIIGGFDLSIDNGAAIPQLMAAGVQRMDRLFADAFAAGRLRRDPSLNQPPPPPLPEEELPDRAPVTYTIQVVAPNAATYNSALAHLRAVPGVDGVQQMNIALGSVSNFFVSYRGDLGTLRSVLMSRGWGVDVVGNQLRMYVRPTTPAPAPAPAPEAPPANTVEPEAGNRTTAATAESPQGGIR